MTYTNAPDVPTEIGDQWTNPDTGVEYEWNGERWIIVGSANYDAQYVNRSGDTMTGPFLLDGQPTVPRMASDKSYVDDEIDKVKEEIAVLAIEKGTSRNYQVSSLTSLAVSDPGNLALNNSDPLLVTQVALALTDIGGQESRIPTAGDVIEFDRVSDGKTMKYVISSVPNGNSTYMEVGARSGTLDAFAVGELYSTFLYPQQSDDLAHLNADQHFTGVNTFENRTKFEGTVTLNSNDNSHRLYMKDQDGNTNFSLFPNGSFTTKSHITFQPQKFSTFNERYSSYIRVDPPVGWKSGDGDFGFYIDISRANTQHNRFTVGGRAGRERAFEVYDDGQGRMRVYGNARIDNNLHTYGELTVDDECNFKEDVHVYGKQNSPTASLVINKTYLVVELDLTATNAVSTWISAGALSLQLGSVFKCTKTTTLPSGNKASEIVTKPDLQVANDIYCGGALFANDVEAHTFMFDGDGGFKGNVIFEDKVTLNGNVTTEDVKVNDLLDVSDANHTLNGALPKSYFTRVMKEFNNEFRSIYINDGTNGTTDPPIQIKADSVSRDLIQLKNNSNGVRWGVNIHNSHMFGGTTSAPWIPTSNHHFTTKKYVDDQFNSAKSTSNVPTGMYFKFGGDSTSISAGEFILNGNRLIFDTYNDDSILWLGGITTEAGEQAIWAHCSIYRPSGSNFTLDRMYQLEKMRVGTTFNGRRTLNFSKIYLKFGSGLPLRGTRYLISCSGFF